MKDFLKHQIKYGWLFKKKLAKIKKYYSLSAQELQDLEDKKIRLLLSNAIKKSPFYKELYARYGVNLSQIQNRDDLKNLPSISKQDIINQVDNIYFGSKLRHTAHTSGTSGSPLKVYYSVDCILNEASYNEIFRNNAGHRTGQRTVSLRGNLGRKKLSHYDKNSNTLYLSSYNLNHQNFKFYYQQIKNFKPNSILAYPSSLEILANYLLQERQELNVPLIFTSSETLYEFQRYKIEKSFNSKIFDRYGNAERTISLVQMQHNSDYEEAKLYSINEFKKDKIFTTNLISPTFPLIRYEVEDKVKLNKQKSTKFNAYIDEIIGRTDDVLLLKDGTQIGRMDLVFKGINNIAYAQIIQENIEFFDINLVVTQKFSKEDLTQLNKNIIARVGEENKYQINYIQKENIIKTKKGKYKLVINKIV